MLPTITGEFTVVADPELRFTPSGAAVANIRAVANKKKKNEQTGEWVDDKHCWVNLTAWNQMAENVAESIVKGMKVVVTGRLETRDYETSDGQKRISVDVEIFEIGPSLRFATAKVTKAERRSAESTGSRPPAEDTWATSPSNDEPPF
jgi:single-strand DNA-binding protein